MHEVQVFQRDEWDRRSVSDDKTSTCNKGDALRSRPDENVVRKRKLFLSNVFMLYLCEAVIGSTCSD